MTVQWDEPRTELLTRLWLSGETARKIAERLGGGITRNAVIGKAHRLGLTGKQGSKSAALKRTRTAPPKTSNQQPKRKPKPKNRARER
jgi:GcrA cell cycle regulator